MTYHVSFTVRLDYFLDIRYGRKTREVRRATERWLTIQDRVLDELQAGRRVEAVFLSGRYVARATITDARLYASAPEALGREPSAQGWKDVGHGSVIGFDFTPLAPP